MSHVRSLTPVGSWAAEPGVESSAAPLRTVPRQGDRAATRRFHTFVIGRKVLDVPAMSKYVRHYMERKVPGDPDDFEQDAALAILETIARGNLDAQGSPASYCIVGAIRKSGLRARRMRSNLTFGRDSMEKHAEEWSGREPVAECGHAPRRKGTEKGGVVLSTDGPGRAAASDRARAVIREHVAAMPRRERRFLSSMLGIGTEEKSARQAARSTGNSPALARRAVAMLSERIAADAGAEALAGVIFGS